MWQQSRPLLSHPNLCFTSKGSEQACPRAPFFLSSVAVCRFSSGPKPRALKNKCRVCRLDGPRADSRRACAVLTRVAAGVFPVVKSCFPFSRLKHTAGELVLNQAYAGRALSRRKCGERRFPGGFRMAVLWSYRVVLQLGVFVSKFCRMKTFCMQLVEVLRGLWGACWQDCGIILTTPDSLHLVLNHW